MCFLPQDLCCASPSRPERLGDGVITCAFFLLGACLFVFCLLQELCCAAPSCVYAHALLTLLIRNVQHLLL